MFTHVVLLFQSIGFNPPARLRSNDFVVGTSGLQIAASDAVSVQAINVADASCAAFIVLPVSGLGRYYHVVSWLAPSVQAQFGVVAVEDNTVVTITFPRSNGVQVPYDGRNYTDLEVITVTLDAFETIQLRDIGNNDLTGTRVVATKEVAVFSGNYRTSKSSICLRPFKLLHLPLFCSRTNHV